MAIQRLYFYYQGPDRDAQWPHVCSAAASECVRVAPRAEALFVPVDVMRKGAGGGSVVAVCCLTCRLGCSNGLGRCLLLMFNLLLVVFRLKGACWPI